MKKNKNRQKFKEPKGYSHFPKRPKSNNSNAEVPVEGNNIRKISPTSNGDLQLMNRVNRPIIFQGELEYIYRCILDCPDIETGGELFGYFTAVGTPVVMYAIGPGKNANHQTAFFNQDIDYLVKTGNEIKSQCGLHHIGEWHSHHSLGLSQPSPHDESTMVSTIRVKRLGQFLLCIGNCRNRNATLNPFLCDDNRCQATDWNVIPAESPVRKHLDITMAGLLVHPQTKRSSLVSEVITVKPSYPQGYWLEEKSNNLALQNIYKYISGIYGPKAEMNIKLDEKGIVHLLVQKMLKMGIYEEDIIFQYGFPEKGPIVAQYVNCIRTKKENEPEWFFSDNDITTSFIKYYNSL